MIRWAAAWGAFALLFTGMAWGLEPPSLTGRVVDRAGVIESFKKEQIERLLEEHEEATSNQIAVLVVPGLEGDVLEDFSIRTVESWKLGTEKGDNGVLLLVAMAERKMRIEVGYGLEGAIPDAMAKRIIDDVLKPEFKAGRFGGGIESAVINLIQLANGEKPEVESSKNSGEQSFTEWAFSAFWNVLHFGFYGLFWLVSSRARRNGRGGRSGRSGFRSSSSFRSGRSFSGGGGSFGGGGASGGW